MPPDLRIPSHATLKGSNSKTRVCFDPFRVAEHSGLLTGGVAHGYLNSTASRLPAFLRKAFSAHFADVRPRKNSIRFFQRLFRSDVEPQSGDAPNIKRRPLIHPLHQSSRLIGIVPFR